MPFPSSQPKPKLGNTRGGLAKIGNMRQLQVALWEVIDKLRTEIATKRKLIAVLPLKACHTLATLAGVYVKLHEVADLAPRLEVLEKLAAGVGPTGATKKPWENGVAEGRLRDNLPEDDTAQSENGAP